MGICDCRKRTNLFCFVHKKAVCPGCVLQHNNCYVSTYLDWIQNSEFESPSCPLCKGAISQENAIRLSCLDLFHIDCLDRYCASLPSNTAQAGYTCPKCSKPLIPTDTGTALAKHLYEVYSQATWFQRGGGLQILKPSEPEKKETRTPLGESSTVPSFTTTGLQSSHSRKSRSSNQVVISQDEDEDKYRKHSFWSFLSSLGLVDDGKKSADPSKSKRPVNTRRMLVLFVLLSILATIIILHMSSNNSTE